MHAKNSVLISVPYFYSPPFLFDPASHVIAIYHVLEIFCHRRLQKIGLDRMQSVSNAKKDVKVSPVTLRREDPFALLACCCA